MQATEHATIQRDQAHAREKALSEEVDVLHERLKSSAGKVRHHPSHTSAFVKLFAKGHLMNFTHGHICRTGSMR